MPEFDSRESTPTANSRPTVTVNDRIASGRVYIEPDLYTIAQRVAEGERKTFSTWARALIVKELVRKGELPPDLMVKLLAA